MGGIENIKKTRIFFIRSMRPLRSHEALDRGCGGSFHRLCSGLAAIQYNTIQYSFIFNLQRKYLEEGSVSLFGGDGESQQWRH